MKTIGTILLAILAASVFAADIAGKVIKVYDGDTIRIEDFDGGKFKVRFADIDAPESTQHHGQEAKIFLTDLLIGQAVSIHFTEIDMYGRIVGTVYLEGAESINAVMVRNGHAWWYRAYSKDKGFEKLESAAKNQKLGLWEDNAPLPPWEYRKTKKNKN